MPDDGRSLREIGAARMREGRFGEAADTLTEAVAQRPDDEAAWRLLGGALASKGDADGAVAAFAQAAALRPDIAKNHYNLGLALQRIGRADEARARFEQTLSIDPGYAQARTRLSEMAPPAPTPTPDPPAAPEALSPAAFRPLGGDEDAPPADQPTSSFGQAQRPTSSFGQAQRPASAYDAPPPILGQRGHAAGYDQPPVQANTIFTLGLVGLVGGFVCVFPALVAPIAWVMGNSALRTLEQSPNADPNLRSQVTAGRIMGIVGTVAMALGVLLVILLFLIGMQG